MELTLTRPDDWHLHVRDSDALTTVVAHTARQFARAIIMPNLQPPVTKTAQALAYRERILAAVPEGLQFTPLMTLYLTDQTTADDIVEAKNSNRVQAVKLYPAGGSTGERATVWRSGRTGHPATTSRCPSTAGGSREVSSPDASTRVSCRTGTLRLNSGSRWSSSARPRRRYSTSTKRRTGQASGWKRIVVSISRWSSSR